MKTPAPAALRLSPYHPGHDAAVTTALRHLLGVPASVGLQWRDLVPQDERRLRLEVRVGDDEGAMRLRLGEPEEGPCTWQGATLRLEVMQQHGETGSVGRSLARRLAALERAGDPGLEALVAAVAAHRASAAVPPGELCTIGPRELLLRLTFRCNQDCSFCWQDRQWPSPPREVYERWMEEADAQGVRQVLFSGGEPTLSPLLVPLLERARAFGMRAGIQSNAIQLAKPHVRTALIEAGLGFASVSYHSHDAALSDAMTRAPGTHLRTERGIVAALEDGLPVSLNLVLERRNLGTLVETARQIVARFGPSLPDGVPLTVSISHPNAYFDREQWLETMAPLDEVEPVLRQAVALLQAAGVVVRADGPCGFPLCTLRAVPEAIPPGAIDEVADANLEARGAASACERCALQDACVGPRKTYLEQFGERGLVPFERLPAHFSGA